MTANNRVAWHPRVGVAAAPTGFVAAPALDLEDDDLQGSHGFMRRRTLVQEVNPGSLNTLSARYEGLDYDTCENQVFLDEERKRDYQFVVWMNLSRWLVILLVGILTAFIASIIDIGIEEISGIKFKGLKKSINKYTLLYQLFIPHLLWVSLNVGMVSIGSVLVAFVEPVAGGSGIPQVKCYLNGVMVPRVVGMKVLLVRTIGVISAVTGGLAGGKEGPMVHSGAVIAANVSRIFKYFREDREKRDFVSAGAAAGVSAAFGAPIGGVLFSLEEGTSFWNQALTWRTFFGTVVSTFTVNFVLSTYHGHPGELSYPGLLNLGRMEPFDFGFYELPVFMFFGAVGGILGSLWNYINAKMAVFRIRYVKPPWLRVLEACIVAATSATVALLMMFLIDDCIPLSRDPTKAPLQLYCADGEHHALAANWLETPEASLRSFIHDPMASYKATSILVFVVCYFLLSAWTFGMAASCGLFIPSLLIGSAWGRLLAMCIQYILPNYTINPAKYALVGAAAQLGGVVRMTISLTVIIIETTGQMSNALPIIITLVVAKWVGDFFGEGIYETYIQLAAIPILPWEPPPLTHTVYASEVMSHPVITFRTVEKVGQIVEILKSVTYNGFPIVEPPSADDPKDVHCWTKVSPKDLHNDPSDLTPVVLRRDNHTDQLSYKNKHNPRIFRQLRGMILRSQLTVLIKNKLYTENASTWSNLNVDVEMFRKEYPHYPSIEKLQISDWEMTCTIDLRPFMNPSPYTLPHAASLPRLFQLFRSLGLRHLPIVNDVNEVVGMVTRKDIARYRVWRHLGHMGLEKLLLSY